MCRAAPTTITLFFAAGTQTRTQTQTQTISFPGPSSHTLKPIGVGANGATTYFIENVQSEFLGGSAHETTYTSGGKTIATIVQVYSTVTAEPITQQGTSHQRSPSLWIANLEYTSYFRG